MDLPRHPPSWRSHRAGIAVGVTIGLLAGYGYLRDVAIGALQVGSSAGVALAGGLPASEPESPPRPRVAGAARLEAASTRQQADAASTRSGGLFRPAYTPDGDVTLPASYREWIFVGAATGLAYGEPGRARHDDAPGTFTHVYLEPGAFRHYRESGEFQEGTTFALEMREPTGGVSIATDGRFAGRSTGVHLAIKDTERLGGWAYFNVGRGGLARRIRSNTCNACHTEHGAVDNVFVQFYPVLTEE